jgi:hypothetical protein
MHESRARVITYSSATQRQRGIAQRQSIDSGNANINGVSLQVLAVFGHPGRAGAKKFIAPRSPVPANDVDFGARMPDRRSHIGKNVEDPWIVVLDVPGAMIAQEVVKLFFSFRKVNIAATVHNVKVLARMGVIKAETMFLHRSGFGGGEGITGGDDRQNQKSPTEPKCQDGIQQANLQPTVRGTKGKSPQILILPEERVSAKLAALKFGRSLPQVDCARITGYAETLDQASGHFSGSRMYHAFIRI